MKINLIEYFESTVDSFPERVALVDKDSELSFKQFRERARFLGNRICQVSSTLNQPIAIFLPKCNDAIMSSIAILYSGNCYAPLDVKTPISRLKAILEALGPLSVITNNSCLKNLKSCELDIPIINIDELEFKEPINEQFGFSKCIDVDPAYILHTSGSTGLPKGVVISHRSIIDYISWAISVFDITENEKIGNQTPFIFDMSTLDIYMMIFTGATLYLIPEQKFIFPATLLDYLDDHQINLIFWVPSVLVNVANLRLLDTKKIPSIKKVLFGGEVMPSKHLGYWIENLGRDVIYANLYGPTEITGTCSCHIVDDSFRDDQPLPIGKANRNTDIIVLNEKDELCEIGETGELCVRGSSLALGYWNSQEKTSKVFVQNPLNKSFDDKIYRTGDIVYFDKDEVLMYIGRKDFQIKLNGYRIDLGDIEHTILSTFDTINAGVFFHQIKNQIILIYESENEISTREFRTKLSSVLSKHMIPTKYIKMNPLPKSTAGKIDRSYLNDKLDTFV